MSLIHQRCFNHGGREAVARCPLCTNYYCRECVTEHQHQLICATCLASNSRGPGQSQKAWSRALGYFPSVLGLLLAWIFFYGLGRCLLAIPSSFHDAAVWNKFWNEL